MAKHVTLMGYLGALALASAVVIAPPNVAVALGDGLARPAQAAAQEPASAKTWIGHAAEIEEYMRTAAVVRTDMVGRGVTRPRRAFLAPGGPVESVAWKLLKPGMSGGYYESYKSEIAAYELDKLLGLNMVPPKVERKVEKDTGVAIMWIASTKSFKDMGGAPRVPREHAAAWSQQLSRAKMFHNLIGDIDPNLGNWLVDPAWNLILIDHSRALTGTKTLVHEMQGVDADLWERMKALTEESLTAAVGMWLGQTEIRALLDRRSRMQVQIDKLARRRH